MGCGASTVQSVAEPALSGKTTAIDPPSQQELYDAARAANAKQVQMMLAAGAVPGISGTTKDDDVYYYICSRLKLGCTTRFAR